MTANTLPSRTRRRTLTEWVLHAAGTHGNPFTDVNVVATFTAPGGQAYRCHGFYDDDGVFRVRFNFPAAGTWRWSIVSFPADAGLTAQGTIEVAEKPTRGFVRSTPRSNWTLTWESGEPLFVLGDTAYNLFGAAYCGLDVEGFLRRRASLGFNLIRVRAQVSRYHPPKGYSQWQTRSCWPWGGTEQMPEFHTFNAGYFRAVDRVMDLCEELGIVVELIPTAWGFEFPFNNRALFLAEWEELYFKYLIARYDAYTCLGFWTIGNEYEYYPNGVPSHKKAADLWALRMGRFIKAHAPHGHVVSIHNAPHEPIFSRRFTMEPGVIDHLMYQEWGAHDAENGWLASGIEDAFERDLAGWEGSVVLSEYGYERDPDHDTGVPLNAACGPEHTRRGAWRGAFCRMGVVHGFDHSWGPRQVLDKDQEGVVFLLHMKRFFTEVLPFADLVRARDMLDGGTFAPGRTPLVLATADRRSIAVYLPAGGECGLKLDSSRKHSLQWFDPRTGALSSPAPVAESTIGAPDKGPDEDRPWDWVAVVKTLG